jgi:hypothetical protein
MNYDKFFNGGFTKISNEFIDNLIDFQFDGEWPYQLLDEPVYVQFIQRFQTKLKLKTHHTSKVIVTSINESDFILLTKKYLSDLYFCIKDDHDEVMVTHNALEPFNPCHGLNLFNNGKSIIVQRDPRDIYASTFQIGNSYIPKYETKYMWKLKMNMLGANDIDEFCHRQLVYFNQAKLLFDSNILRLNYEDIVLDYENVLKKIYNFLEIEESLHVNKGYFFKPQLSIKNIGLWKKFPDQNAIKKIESQLKPYCFYDY